MAKIDLSHIAHSLPVIFYSNDIPDNVVWPYWLVHTDDYHHLEKIRFEHAIIDIHVHRFREYGDYPLNVLLSYWKLVEKLADRYRDRFTFTLPDLPFDPRYFHGVQYPYNVRKTYTYHVMFFRLANLLYRKFGTTCILVVQHRQSVQDAKRSCCFVQDLLCYVDDDAVFAVGVGSLCINRSPRQIAEYLNAVACRFPRFRIHGFGVRVDTVRYLRFDIRRYSFDGTGWTRTPNRLAMYFAGLDKRHSAYTQHERTIYFLCGLISLARNVGRPDIVHELIEIIEKVTGKHPPKELLNKYTDVKNGKRLNITMFF